MRQCEFELRVPTSRRAKRTLVQQAKVKIYLRVLEIKQADLARLSRASSARATDEETLGTDIETHPALLH
jgi:hypothetical protein